MANIARGLLNVLFWILLNVTLIGCQNAVIGASTVSLIEGESLTLTCNYTGSTTVTTVLWYNKTDENFLALKPNSSFTGACNFFSKAPSFKAARVSYSCNSANNIYTLRILSVQVEDAGLWSCKFEDHLTGSPGSNTTVHIRATTTTNSSAKSGRHCTLELGFGLGISFGIQCIIICIIVMIYKCKDIKNASVLGKLLGIGLRTTVDVCLVIYVIFQYKRNECNDEHPIGLVLGSSIPYVIACIVDLFFVCKCKGSPRKGDIAKGFFKGLEITSVFIVLVELLYTYLKGQSPELTSETPEEDPTEPSDIINITENKGSRSALSRKDVQIQMETKGVKSDKKERPPPIHIGTQNKAEPKSASKQINDRPLPPLETGFKNTRIFRPQPPPPQNIYINDQYQRRIAATFDDTQGLPSETPGSIKLPPLLQKQQMVEKEDAKKKRKKQRKKGQMEDGNPDKEMAELK